MKTQMRFQKILSIVTIIIGALGVVLALFFCSGAFNQACRLYDGSLDTSGLEQWQIDLDQFVVKVQGINDTLFTLGIVLVVISVLPVIAGCQKRRNYYITNYIAVGVVVIFQIVYIIIVATLISQAMSAYSTLDLDTVAQQYNGLNFNVQYGEFSTSPWTPVFGYIVIGLLAVGAVLSVLNVIWKILLMKGEKALLAKYSVVEEVA